MLTVSLSAAGIYLLLLVFKAYLSLRYANQMNVYSVNPDEPIDVTIMQPILSGDPLLESSLRHNLTIVPQGVKFVWLIDNDDTVALELTKSLAELNPNITRVMCPSVPQHLNPKIFKLAFGFEQVTTPLVAVLDDDTCLSKGSLQQAQYGLNHAEIYTGLPCYDTGPTIWSSLLAHFVNNNSILTYLPVLAFTKPFSLNGMFYMLKRETLVAMGGFEAISHQLTDDYAMAQLVKKHGGNIMQGVTAQTVRTSVKDFSHYLRLMHRWFLFASLQISDQSVERKLLLVIFLVTPSLLFWISVVGLLTHVSGVIILLVLVLFRYAILNYLQRKLLNQPPRFSFGMSILSECFQPFHMLHALIDKNILWRKRQIRVEPDGTFSYLETLVSE
jgi:ceramide glucosyltransferase